jgi:hypothetical protein
VNHEDVFLEVAFFCRIIDALLSKPDRAQPKIGRKIEKKYIYWWRMNVYFDYLHSS